MACLQQEVLGEIIIKEQTGAGNMHEILRLACRTFCSPFFYKISRRQACPTGSHLMPALLINYL